MRHNPIYGFCMLFFPIIVIIFFTSLMQDGLPTNMPIGIVDQDNTSTTRSLVRRLNAFQTSEVVAHYPNVNAARQAIQRNEIYAFFYIPKHTTKKILSNRQPKISFYYSSVTLIAGSMQYRDLKVISALTSAAVGAEKLAAVGKTNDEIRANLQPIALDMHMINNPWMNYNIYLSTFIVPGILMVFLLILTPYSIGTELKFRRSREWLRMANGNIYVALIGKFLPITLIFLILFYGFQFYIFYFLNFPHPGGVIPILLNGLLAVLACQGFGIFIFGWIPSLRMSMSVCSLWSVLSFSLCGASFPIFAMHEMLQGVAQLFPLRHYFLIYRTCIFNDFPLSYVWVNILALMIFTFLPFFTTRNIRRAMLVYSYIP